MTVEIDLLKTPVTLLEFCEIAKISPMRYYHDKKNGYISCTCAPFPRYDYDFSFSNLADILMYCLIKKLLAANLSIETSIEAAKEYLTALLALNQDDTEHLTPENLSAKISYRVETRSLLFILKDNLPEEKPLLDFIHEINRYFADTFIQSAVLMQKLINSKSQVKNPDFEGQAFILEFSE